MPIAGLLPASDSARGREIYIESVSNEIYARLLIGFTQDIRIYSSGSSMHEYSTCKLTSTYFFLSALDVTSQLSDMLDRWVSLFAFDNHRANFVA